jgi:hypothetical protein
VHVFGLGAVMPAEDLKHLGHLFRREQPAGLQFRFWGDCHACDYRPECAARRGFRNWPV